MSTARSRTRPDYEANRARVLRIGAELFSRNGYHGTGMAELEKAVGLGRGGLYHYIGSKEALLYDISWTQVDAMIRAAEVRLEGDDPPLDLVRGLARDLLGNIAQHQAEWTVFFRDFSALTGARRDRVIAARERYEGCWRRALGRGVRAGVFRAGPPLLVKGLLGMFNYTYLWLDPEGALSPQEVADTFVELVFLGLAPRP